MKLNSHELINILKSNSNWIEANYLADYFSVTTRTIRKHIRDINKKHDNLIISSYKGYKINSSDYDIDATSNDDEINKRVNFIIRKLITSKEPLNIYDLADELNVSDSSFERALKKAKNILKDFSIETLRKRNTIFVDGKERNKRKIINFLINEENKNNYLLNEKFDYIDIDININEIHSFLADLFSKNGIIINDYGMQTIVFHIAIMIDRLNNGNNILDGTKDDTNILDSLYYNITKEIKKFISKNYKLHLPKSELLYLTIIISNNCNNFDFSIVNKDNLNQYIEKEYIDLVKRITSDLIANYSLETFSDDFIVNLTIHIRNLIIRIKDGTYTQNPLAINFKNQYPLIYDMATFIIKEINDYLNIQIIDDEIAFIAFHIGSYIENNKKVKDKINACFLYVEYHDFHSSTINKINNVFQFDLYLTSALSTKDIDRIPQNIDLVISCANIELPYPTVNINMFITDKDIENIRTYIDAIKLKRKKELLKENLNHFIGKKLFKKEFYTSDSTEMIKTLSKECIDLGLCDSKFTQEVLERERLSSTSFRNGVAIPHSLKPSAHQSFMYVVSNSKKNLWGRNEVNIIILIGTSLKDRKKFKQLYDDVCAILYEPINVKLLSKCSTYDEFINKMIDLMS